MLPVRGPRGTHSYLTLSNFPPLRNPFAESTDSPGPSRSTPVAGRSSARNLEEDLGLRITPNTRIQYQVQHGYFRWTIENFSAFPPVSDKYCLSPIFVLKDTWWHLALHPKVTICGRDCISLNLIRHRSDHGPKSVRVSYRLGLENGGNKIWFKPEENIAFGKGDSYGLRTSVLGHLEDFLEDDNLSIRCEMYVTYPLSVNNTSPPGRKITVDTDLPSNLFSIYATGELHDTIIEIPSKRIKAHKSVLSARSMTFARMLEDGKTVIQLSCTLSCLQCVLVYLYSSNFDFLTKKAIFSIGLYELACELSLDRLKDLLKPHNIEKKSKITIDYFSTEFTLHKFEISDLFSDSMGSAVYFDKATGMGVKISLQKVVSHETVEVLVKVSGIVAAIDFSFELYLLDMDNQPIEMIPATFSQDSEASYEKLIFTYSVGFPLTDILRCGLFDGNLYIAFVCQRHSLIHLLDDCVPAITEPPCIDSDEWLEDLSIDMSELFTSGFLSDVTVVTGSGQYFYLHRSILAARSTHFHRLFFYEQFKNQFLILNEFDSRTFELIFTYMYVGTLKDRPDITRNDLLEMYEASEVFSMNSLKHQCEKFLVMVLDPFFAQEVLGSANHFVNLRLAAACRDYLRRHFGAQEDPNADTDSDS